MSPAEHPESAVEEARPSLTTEGVRRGIVAAVPFAGSTVVYGIGFGILAAQIGIGMADAVIMSALVFSGSAQMAVVQSWNTSAALLPIFVTVVVANARYILMGASLRTWLSHLPKARTLPALLTLVDGAYAIGLRERALGRHDAGIMLGAALFSYVGWVFATGLGFAFGRLIPDPKLYALDFIIVAFCASAVAQMWRGTSDALPAGVALASAIVADRLYPGPLVIVAAAVAAILTGGLRHVDRA
jgi:predicted branched-subunit amino acid permease